VARSRGLSSRQSSTLPGIRKSLTIMLVSKWIVLFVLVTGFSTRLDAASRSVPIEVNGCVIAKSNGCILLISGNDEYDVSSARPRIDPNQHLGVVLTGERAITSSCKRAVPHTKIKWSYTKQLCP
jgi:hypothetical protein